ncbi:hypothetical protein EYF80_066368 [Liparis tanakae]|uniref:Uncharacterized protein n=1 Tax=Liparis tanakae TaxID=230148 RepID=A0A4Z2E589_9TELE|nr:hypothetical protein EYF80_066368 [Liparis tanakae]
MDVRGGVMDVRGGVMGVRGGVMDVRGGVMDMRDRVMDVRGGVMDVRVGVMDVRVGVMDVSQGVNIPGLWREEVEGPGVPLPTPVGLLLLQPAEQSGKTTLEDKRDVSGARGCWRALPVAAAVPRGQQLAQ